ncbi:transglutaminase domain-containing protein [Microcoleus sp. FACHB-53]|nr:transglutaminase domain-containing protein [Microcoleus sp. FACHB-53]
MKQAKTDWEGAIILRDHVYSRNKIFLPIAEVPVPLTVEKYKAIVSGQSPQICTGMSLAYIGLLQAFDIPARLVSLANNEAVNRTQSPKNSAAKIPDTHSTVEVFLDKRWVLQDPSFNTQWELDGKPLGALELRQAYLSKKNPISTTNGRPVLPRRSLQEFYIPYQDVLAYVEISEIEILNPKNAGSFKVVVTMPPGPTWRHAVQSSPLAPSLNNEKETRVRDWDLSEHLPMGWETLPNAKVWNNSQEKGIGVKTDASNSGYQLWSVPESLPGGDYQVRVKGDVLDGGLYIGVLDTTTQQFISTAYYWSGQRNCPRNADKDDCFKKSDMMAKFSLKETKPIKIILANWSYEMQSSTWNVKNVAIAKNQTVSSKP